MSPMKIAVIGFGGQTKSDHYSFLIDNPDFELVGIVEPNPINFEEISFPLYSTVDELLSKTQIDAALIATPHNTHFEITSKLLKRGVAVLKEKPLAICLKEAIELNKLSIKHGAPLLINVQRRLMSHYMKGRELLKKIGKPFLIEGVYHIYVDNPHEGWRGKKEIAGGGCVLDMGYHLIDVLNLYLGLPSSVSLQATNSAMPNEDYDAEDTATIMIGYEKRQIFGCLSISRFSGPKTEYIKISGDQGILKITKKAVILYSSDGQEISRIEALPSVAAVDHFCDTLKFKSESVLSASNHINNMALIEAAYLSASCNKVINPQELI